MLDEPRVLIVDDDVETRKLLKSILISYDIRVTLCENATEALLAVMGGNFDYILTDFRMPGMDGIDLASARTMLPPMTVIIGMSSGDMDEVPGGRRMISS
jgi:CheY-like chemotaxis protein